MNKIRNFRILDLNYKRKNNKKYTIYLGFFIANKKIIGGGDGKYKK